MKKIFGLLIVLLFSSCTPEERVQYSLVKAIDGDSILIKEKNCADCKALEVRLLGIDAPEYNQGVWGKRAHNFVARVLDNSEIFIEQDYTKQDKFGRTLAYVFYLNQRENASKVKMLNLELIEHGLAEVYFLAKDLKYLDEFKLAESRARKESKAIWDKKNGLDLHPYEYRKKHM